MKKKIKEIWSNISPIIVALIGAAALIWSTSQNNALEIKNSALTEKNSALEEENSRLKEENSQLKDGNTTSESGPTSSTGAKANSDEEIIARNLDAILKKKAEYIYSDIYQFEDDSLDFFVREKAGYIYRNIGDTDFITILDGKVLPSIKVIFLDYQTDNVVFSLQSNEIGWLKYSPGNTKPFYCVVISPEYELYVSRPLQMKDGNGSPSFGITLDKLNCDFSPIFQVCIYARDSSQSNQSYSLLPNASTVFRCIEIYSDPILSHSTNYLSKANDSGLLDFNGCYFSLDSKYVLDIALYAEHISSDESDLPYESPSQTVKASISSTNLINVYLEYDGNIVSLQQISE